MSELKSCPLCGAARRTGAGPRGLMITKQIVKALLAETEQLWLVELQARRAAVAKEREYRAALLEWAEAEVMEAQKKGSNDRTNDRAAR